ncbi:MAG: hypothetical protein ACE5FM_04295 [Methyloligellaceae bacterium]
MKIDPLDLAELSGAGLLLFGVFALWGWTSTLVAAGFILLVVSLVARTRAG